MYVYSVNYLIFIPISLIRHFAIVEQIQFIVILFNYYFFNIVKK
jgi:hypothetical protein